MEIEFVAKFFRDIDDDVLLQQFHETSMVMDGELLVSIGAFLYSSLLNVSWY